MHYLLFYDYVSDYLARREAYRAAHLAHAKPYLDRGEILLGGAFADLDANGDAMLSQDEMTAAYGADGSARFMARDSNGDGMLTAAEFGVAAGDEPDYRDAREPAIETEGFDDQGFGNTDEN